MPHGQQTYKRIQICKEYKRRFLAHFTYEQNQDVEEGFSVRKSKAAEREWEVLGKEGNCMVNADPHS